MRQLYFDRNGDPLELMQWATLINDQRYRVVEQTAIADDVDVSTIWMGLDHSCGRGEPLIFESKIFGGPLDGEQQRYSTESEACAGHAELILRARAAQKSLS